MYRLQIFTSMSDSPPSSPAPHCFVQQVFYPRNKLFIRKQCDNFLLLNFYLNSRTYILSSKPLIISWWNLVKKSKSLFTISVKLFMEPYELFSPTWFVMLLHFLVEDYDAAISRSFYNHFFPIPKILTFYSSS